MIEPVDAFGKTLKKGDIVAQISGYTGGATYLTKGHVVGFTEKRIKVKRDLNMPGGGSNVMSSRLVLLNECKCNSDEL